MPPKPIFDLSKVDLDHVEFTREEIRAINPHRYEFEQLTAILRFDPEAKLVIGMRELADDEFWVRGHIPGTPIFPGVLMVEAAAQLSSFYSRKLLGNDGFFAFGGIDKVRFRGIVRPGEKLIIGATPRVLGPSRSMFDAQGYAGGKIVFEATILGVRVYF